MSKELEELKSSISNWYGELKRSIGIDNINLIKKLIDEQALTHLRRFKMIKHDEVRQHLSMWSRSARPLMREYITQQEELTKAVKEYFTLLNSDAINQNIIDRTDLLEETIKEMVGIK